MTRSSRALVVAFSILAVTARPAATQSLAEAAKKAEDAKKSGKPAKAYTDKDLGPVPAAPAIVDVKSEPKAEPSKTSSATATPETKEPPKDEAYWRERIAPLLGQLAGQTAKLEVIDRRIAELTRELGSIGPKNARWSVAKSESSRLIAQAEQLRTEIKWTKAQIDVVAEEGRRAGALPGWFR
jgi:hypothetical protein